MERSLLKEVSDKGIKARIKNNAKPMLWPQFFPSMFQTKLTWETLVGTKGAPVAASVISYDASAPLITREVISKKTGDIPKIAVKMKMGEKEWNEYNELKNMSAGDAAKQALINLVYDDVDKTFNSVNGRLEWLAMQALSYGQLTLSKTNNPGGLVNATTVDFGIPTANKDGVIASWATPGSAKPIEDLAEVQQNAEDAGYSMKYVLMRRSNFNQFKAAADTKDKVAYFIGGLKTDDNSAVSLTLSAINQYLESEGLPRIVVVNPTVRIEGTSGTRTSTNAWKENYIAYIPDLKVGAVKHAPIAEEQSPSVRKKAIMSKSGPILTSKWAELEPFAELTKSQANAFPVFDDPSGIFLQKVTATSWS